MNGATFDISGMYYPDFLQQFKTSLSQLFEKENINKLSLSRGLPANVWKEIMNLKPLSVTIPKEFGGRGTKVKV